MMKHTRWFLAAVALCVFAGSVSAVVMRVEPEHIEVSQGDVFTVDITVDPAGSEIMGAQYILYFDDTLLNVTEQTKRTFLSCDGASTNVYTNKINNTLGKIEYSETRTAVDYGVTDQGVLATVTVKAVEPGTCSLDLRDVRLSDPGAHYITDLLVDDGMCDIDVIGSAPAPTPETVTSTTTSATNTTTTPAQSVETPAMNQTPLQSPTALIMSTAVQTPTADQIPSESTSPAPARTARTPERNNMLPGFEASIAMAGLLTIMILKGRRTKR
ncbi:MAG TPA: hypothetical protein EYP67_06345 [Methanosarcinales archaeon]|nr:hypothetical protein [Methanosarcinales archaeon]